MMSGQHHWYACSHARPTYCNVCREALSGVTSHGLSCEVCKFKAHKRCAVRAATNCKWTALASIGKDIIEDEDGISMPHQWMEGNLPVSAKCSVCDKTCGSVLRLQDWRCLWCRAMVHSACKEGFGNKCPLGQCRVSILPPTAISTIDSDGYWEGSRPHGTSPLLVYVNTKSGDNQVLISYEDSMASHLTKILHLNASIHSFINHLFIHSFTHSFIPQCDAMSQYEDSMASHLTKILHLNASIHSFINHLFIHSFTHSFIPQCDAMSQYEDSMASHLTKILQCEDHQVVISSAKVLCETVKAFVDRVSASHDPGGEGEKDVEDKTMGTQFDVLNEKLQSLLNTLDKEAEESKVRERGRGRGGRERERGRQRVTVLNKMRGQFEFLLVYPSLNVLSLFQQMFKSREALMSRANSLKKAVRQIIEHTERGKLISPLGSASRRISSMSTFNRSASVDSKLSQSPTTKGGKIELQEPAPAKRRQLPTIRLPFVQPASLPGISSSIAKNLSGGGFISKVLLANADALCAAASPLLEQDIPLESYQERCVMNNYFGIGLDAKIALEFQNKREEHPEKCRSRTKNMMWYGVLGGKEMINKTFKNLDQRVLLECDGQRIPLPSLQGIVILNIPSYGGGANFWGGSKQDENFTAPSFDDRILEVVAVFGGIQMAMSRVIDLQHHRIAQCRTVKVTILGDEGVPVQVDGEAWVQPPGYVRIVHKNRAQMLIRSRTFEHVLKSWSEKQKLDHAVSPQPLHLTEDETQVLLNFVEAASSVTKNVKIAAKSHSLVEVELMPGAQHTAECVDRLYPVGKFAEVCRFCCLKYNPILRCHVVDLIQAARILYQEASLFLTDKTASSVLTANIEDNLTASLISLEQEIKKAIDLVGLVNLEPIVEVNLLEHQKRKQGRLKQVYSRLKGRAKDRSRSSLPRAFEIRSWTLEEVGQWLESLALGDYRESFMSHEITGAELLNLERRDLKDLGVTKVGHLKRIQEGIKELHHREAVYDRPSS
ncbi:hypothetical protein EGW08_011299 [Elysia chlorotica]|uniref:diacylglycerol kinase (ATP) n=1 Tax=Elysia chlorotica TaxID=188477 RepID=A0A3S1HJV8_ELYCH|nr:hypothetical protein EGW08_011299 [Elysia chlorotica]